MIDQFVSFLSLFPTCNAWFTQMLQGRWQPRCSLDHENILDVQRTECRATYGGGTATWRCRGRLPRLSHHGHSDNQELENDARYDTQQRHFPPHLEPLPSVRVIVVSPQNFRQEVPVHRFAIVFYVYLARLAFCFKHIPHRQREQSLPFLRLESRKGGNVTRADTCFRCGI